MNVNNKHVVVTGAGSGMGQALAIQLIQRGAKVTGIDRNLVSLEDTQSKVESLGEKMHIVTLDLSDFDKIKPTVVEIIHSQGPIDALINCAGIIQPFVKFNDLNLEDIHRVMNVNFFGMVYLTKEILPGLLERPEAHIVNISSMGGFLPVPGQGMYGASKAAVKLFTEALYAELMESKVRVTLIFPGAVETNITVNSGISMPSFAKSAEVSQFKGMKANEAARQIIEAMEKNKFRACVGSDAKFMDILSRISPLYATKFIAKKMKALLG
jgi:short-subunit dehydrogenase